MRSINWDKSLSEEDEAWILTSGSMELENRLKANREQFGVELAEVPETEDTGTKSALDPTATIGEQGPNVLRPVDPAEDADDEEDEDDYDEWSKADLEAEVDKRHDLEGTPDVAVTGTGKDGNVLKTDLIKALRVWDQEVEASEA